MKVIFLLLVLILNIQVVWALDVVYPKKSSVVINAPSSFFIGSADANKTLTINDEPVNVHTSGGFAHVISLNEGVNNFVLRSGDEVLNFVITRPQKSSGDNAKYNSPQFIEYTTLKEFITSVDNAPLRETPVDFGINRMAHLQTDIPLVVDGEKSGFYRVVLGENKKGWIAKTNVKAFEGYLNSPAVVSGYDYIDSKESFTFIFHLNKKTPFEIIEGETFYLKFYNVKDCEDNTYVFEFPYSEAVRTKKIAGYSGNYDGNDFIFKVRKFPNINRKHPLKNITIAVDAGHGGKEFGAIGCCGDKEKDITLAIAKYLEHELKSRGANVIMTRKEDVYVGLRERVDIANNNDAMFLLSIHGNALPDTANPLKYQGTSIYYYYNQAKLLAANILVTMNEQLKTKNDNLHQGSLALVRNTNALSILIEVAYLINPEDNVMLINPHFQKRCAKAIADGLEKYLLSE